MQPSEANAGRTVRPQNNSYPAGGSKAPSETRQSKGERPKRGVIVAPPSGNTETPEDYTVLHRGFDTLALSIQANIGPELFEYLEAQKAIAEEEQKEVLISFGGAQFLLKPYGGKGYRFLLDGGPEGANWSIKKPNSRDKWGIRLSFGSFFMSIYGLGAAKAHCERVLDAFGVRYGPEDVSISRADFCVDVLVNDLVLDPNNLIAHSAAGRRDNITYEDVAVHGKSGWVSSVTSGGITNRQVIIYNKRSEVIAHGKRHWWDIWNHTLRSGVGNTNAPYMLHRGHVSGPLTPDKTQAAQNQVWRVEFRAGKSLLKDRWGIRTWEQFFEQFGDLCRSSGERIRYTEPDPNDTNRARWPNHPLWDVVCAEMNDDLIEMRSGADPNPMKEVHREEHIASLLKQVTGTCITMAALEGWEHEELPVAFHGFAERMSEAVEADPERSAKQLQDAKDRYVFTRDTREPPT
ncbi:hypothetical protein [Aliiroseovarius marinus]|uniref:hypothetical protein n=1 Tax=Aliiroseovarius marinus TaxID=2500159 RepID=UPI003D7E18FC